MLQKSLKQGMAAALSVAVCASLTAGIAIHADAASKKATWVLVKSTSAYTSSGVTETTSTVNKYDKNGWLKQKDYKGIVAPQKTVYTRNKAGEVKTIKRYTEGTLEEITVNTIKKGKVTGAVVYTIDENKKKIKTQTITYTYKKNKLKGTVTKMVNGDVMKDTYYPNGSLKTDSYKGKGFANNSKYNKKGDMVSGSSVYKQDGKVYSSYKITRTNKYNKKGDLIKSVETAKNTDANGKVTTEKSVYKYSYKYDKAGNIKVVKNTVTRSINGGEKSTTSRTTKNTYKKIMVKQ